MSRRRRVVWSAAAREDLLSIVEHVLAGGVETARRTLDRIESRAKSLSSLPLRGRFVPELARLQVRAYRELQAPPYRIIYRVDERGVLVLAVFDGRRNLEDVLLDRLLRTP